MLGLRKLPRSVVLVGMMGVGKTSIGRRLAQNLEVPFFDSDQEVEKAAAFSVADIYDWYGPDVFKETERRVIHRLLIENEPHILSTGAEAFLDPETRQLISEKGFSIWLQASVETIYPRVSRRSHRPQLKNLQGDALREAIQTYTDQLTPIYAQASLTVNCDKESPEQTVGHLLQELNRRFWPEFPDS